MSRKLISGEEAVPAKGQHRRPCSDCPWSRAALPGWLGSLSAQQWLQAAHGESLIDCHALIGAQCAGAAIYRANVAKLCHSKDILQLPADCDHVFATPSQFTQHHERRSKMALSAKAQQAVRDIDDIIDREYAPGNMTPQEAVEFLEEIGCNIAAKIEALQEEHDL